MSNNTKYLLGFAVVAGIFGLLAFFGYTPFLNVISNTTQQIQQVAGSSAGSNFNTSKIAEQTLTVSTTTVYSVLNTDTSDRTITGADGFITNGNSTSTSYSVICATSTSATGQGTPSSAILAITFTNGGIYGTTTLNGGAYFATTSPGVTGSTTPTQAVPSVTGLNNFARNWTTGTYLVCKSSASANNGLFDPSVTGFLAFPYRGQ